MSKHTHADFDPQEHFTFDIHRAYRVLLCDYVNMKEEFSEYVRDYNQFITREELNFYRTKREEPIIPQDPDAVR